MAVFLVILVLIVVIIIPNIKIVPQSKCYVIERLGSYFSTWSNGLHFKIPFFSIRKWKKFPVQAIAICNSLNYYKIDIFI